MPSTTKVIQSKTVRFLAHPLFSEFFKMRKSLTMCFRQRVKDQIEKDKQDRAVKVQLVSLPERDYVMFRSLPSQICLLSVTFVHPTHGLKLSAIFLRHFVP